MAPAADFNCNREILYKTFSYLNCALQHQDLNRGAWRLLEAHERELANGGNPVDVVITLDFSKGVMLPSGAMVPNGFWKSIYVGTNQTECYYFPNEKPITTDYKKFRISNCR